MPRHRDILHVLAGHEAANPAIVAHDKRATWGEAHARHADEWFRQCRDVGIGVMLRHALATAVVAILLVSRPASAETLTVYTAYEEDEATAFLKVARAEMPDIDIHLLRLSTGDLTARILAEADHPQHDVVWGQAVSNLLDPRVLRTLEPYFPESVGKIPDRFRDMAGRWFAVTGYMAVFCVNNERLRAMGLPMPTSWEDLTNPAYKDMVVMPNPTTSGTGYIHVVSILQRKGEQAGWDELKALDSNIARYTESGSRPCNAARAGEVAVGASFAGRAMQNIIDGYAITMVVPKEGAGSELEGNALVAASRHKAAAKRFLDWTISEKAVVEYYKWKEIVTAKGGFMPVRFKKAGLPEDVSSVLFKMDYLASARDRPAILDRWRTEFSR